MRYKRIGLKISNVLLSAGAVAIFFYLLVLAMAQEQVVAGWSRAPDFKNYNSSLIQASRADEADQRVQAIVEEKQANAAKESGLEADATRAAMAYSRQLVRIEPVIRQFRDRRHCRILSEPPLEVAAVAEVPPQAAAPGNAEAAALAAQQKAGLAAMAAQARRMQSKESELASLRACLDLDKAFGDRAHYLAELGKADELADTIVKIDTDRRRLAQRTKLISDESWVKREELKKSVELRAHYRALDALSGPDWFPIRLTHFPPFIIHVMLSFFSGTFGALLITMVFLVYPSKLRERISTKLYYKRIFLGGLVAVTVFIVLAGGASILGTGQGAQVGTNFMSFTAIGLLAGMFSDTVADWLSARAKTMFKIEEEEAAEDRKADEERTS